MINDKNIHAEIISIGDELLVGQTCNTNAYYIAHQLNTINISVSRITTVGDDKEDILIAFDRALAENHIVLVTGGLGSTKDDITKKCVADYFHKELIPDEGTKQRIEQSFRMRGIAVPQSMHGQSLQPKGCEIIRNSAGIAPGIWVEEKTKVLVAMPGVPQEMQAIMDVVLPKLQKMFTAQAIVHQHIQTCGIGESLLSETLSTVEDQLPPHIKLAYLPKCGYTSLRLSAYGNDMQMLRDEVDLYTRKIENAAKEYIVSLENKTLPEVVADELLRQKKTLAVAESCTGGYMAQQITAIAGCSAYFKGGVIAYSNEIKQRILQVQATTLENQGAVSEQTVVEMATNLLTLFDVDYAVAVSGIAGPGGGSAEKPVGMVWIAAASKGKGVKSACFTFGNDNRNLIIQRASAAAFNMLLKLME
jgi:nicotinamide-nucleotide amidase